MSIKITKKQRQLYHAAEKFLDLGALFKDGKPKIRELTSYKRSKINAALNAVYAMAGGKHYAERDFVPVPKSKKRAAYNAASGLPSQTKGVFINGGAKYNQGVTITRDLTLGYKRGDTIYKSAPLDATNTITLTASIEKHRDTIETSPFTMIGTNGNFIRPMYRAGHAPTDEIIEKSLFLMEKYNTMAANGEQRYYVNGRGETKSRGVAQTMDKWGYSLLWSSEDKTAKPAPKTKKTRGKNVKK